MRVLIAGGRDFTDKQFLTEYMSTYLGSVTTLISGTARGADNLGEEWAKENGIAIERYPAQWSRDGKAAGPIRNAEMLKKGNPDLVVVFEGGKGSAHMASISRKAGVNTVEPRKEIHK